MAMSSFVTNNSKETTYIEGQAIRWRCEGDHGSFGEVKDVSSGRFDHLSSFVGDFKFTLENYLHFMIRVRVHQRGALFEAIEAASDGFLRIVGLA